MSSLLHSQNNIKKQKEIDSLISIVKKNDIYTNIGAREILRLGTEIYYQSKDINYESGMLVGTVKMAEAYMNESNLEMALKKLSEAKLLAEKSQKYLLLATLYIHEATIYSQMGYTKKCRKLLNKALNFQNKLSKEDNINLKVNVYRSIARNLKNENKSTKNNDSVLFYLNKWYLESKNLSDRFSSKEGVIISSAIDMAREYFLRNDLTNAQRYLSEAQKNIDHSQDKNELVYVYILKGDIENKRKNFAEAIKNFDLSIQTIQKYNIYNSAFKEIYSGKIEAYRGLKNDKQQAVYLEKLRKFSDSLSGVEKKIINNVLVNAEEKNIESDENARRYKYLLPAAILLFLAIVSLIFYFLSANKRKNIQEGINNEESHQNLDSFSEQENLIIKNKEYEKEVNVVDLRMLIELAQNNDRSFHLKFTELFPTFNQQLMDINPQLTHSDLEYCSLIKLKFDTKEIAKYKNVTVNSVVSKKYRIRKKLNINTSENIYTWMLNIG